MASRFVPQIAAQGDQARPPEAEPWKDEFENRWKQNPNEWFRYDIGNRQGVSGEIERRYGARAKTYKLVEDGVERRYVSVMFDPAAASEIQQKAVKRSENAQRAYEQRVAEGKQPLHASRGKAENEPSPQPGLAQPQPRPNPLHRG